jgi:hypothetical protein
MFIDPRSDARVRRALRGLARASGAALVVPYFNYATDQSGVLAVTPEGRFTPSRPKQRPMWFLGEESVEAEPRPLHAGPASVGTLLGVDNQDPGLASRLADSDAELIASATHDWGALATQQRALAQLASGSTGVSLVRADWRYGSAIYDRDGEIVADAGEGRRRALLVSSVASPAPTPYARIGDVLGWGALIAALTAFVASRVASLSVRRPRRSRAPGPAATG